MPAPLNQEPRGLRFPSSNPGGAQEVFRSGRGPQPHWAGWLISDVLTMVSGGHAKEGHRVGEQEEMSSGRCI